MRITPCTMSLRPPGRSGCFRLHECVGLLMLVKFIVQAIVGLGLGPWVPARKAYIHGVRAVTWAPVHRYLVRPGAPAWCTTMQGPIDCMSELLYTV